MKIRWRWFASVVLVELALAGCQASVTPTLSAADGPPKQPIEIGPADMPEEQASEVNPLDWLREQPFEPAPLDWPTVITDGLPEGFELRETHDDIKELPSGGMIQVTSVEYLWIEVYVVGSQSAESRLEFLDLQMEGDYEWDIAQISNTQVLRYQSDWEKGRIWVSGPYMIWVFSSDVNKRDLWLDTFAELYMAQPPVPGVGTLLDWLRDKPFEPEPSKQPLVITSGLPEGFEYDSRRPETGNLPGGETVEITNVWYIKSPADEPGAMQDLVEVNIYTFESAAGRSEYLDILVAQGDLSPERRDWGLEQYSSGVVARCYGRNGWNESRIWTSGPHLVMVVLIQEEQGSWVDPFTELYLDRYPAD